MHSSHAARRQKILRLLQNTWVTRNIAVTQSVYRESYREERVHAATRRATLIAIKRGFNLHVSSSSLRRVPEMPYSIFAKFHPVWQRIVPHAARRARGLRVDPVLFLPYSARVQSVGFNGLEAVRNLRPSLSTRVRFTGRSVGCDPR
jgi:hypothetical protein